MATYFKPLSAVGSYFMRKLTVAISLPLKSSLLYLVLTFPFNIILVMTVVFIVVIVRIFTRKTTRINDSIVDMERQSSQENDGEESILTRGAKLKSPKQMAEKEMPRSFKGSMEGVIELYNWFYRFSQWRLGGFGDNMTPREFMKFVSGRIPSQGDLPLEYLVTSFEIAKYSKIKPTREMLSKCLDSVEVLKGLIESGDSRISDDDTEVDVFFSELGSYNVELHEA